MGDGSDLFVVGEGWRALSPAVSAGIQAMAGVSNPERHPALEARKEELAGELRERYGGLEPAELRARAPFAAYHAYYKRFGNANPANWDACAPWWASRSANSGVSS